MTLVEHALRYAARGALVFPLKPNKAPYSTNGMKDGTTDADTIRQWWAEFPDALIGCRIPEGQVVLDIDPRHGGDRVWRALLESYGEFPIGRLHHSGRGDGGFHAWSKHPGGKLSTRQLTEWAKRNNVATKVSTPNGKIKYTCGIDVLHHGHRYTILPPSPHPANGKPYEWDTQGEPVELPGWLAALLEPPTHTDNSFTVPPSSSMSTDWQTDSIADWYTATARWSDILTGWHVVGGDGEHDGSKWRHPNATAESSATIRHGCLFVYTDNTEFDQTEADDPHGYTKFRAYADLHHRGSMSDAARAARELRGGPPSTPAVTTAALDHIEDADSLDDDQDVDEPPQDDLDDDWGRYDLVSIADRILAGDFEPELPVVMHVADSMPLFYAGRTHSLFGPPGGGKTWVALAAVAERIKLGEPVLMIDWEDAAPGTTRRLVQLGCTAADIALLDYRAPATSLAYGWAALTADDTPYTLIVMDSTGEALAAQGINPNDDGEVAGWMAMVKKLTRRPGTPCILLLDHVPKTTDNPHGAPIGSQRKLAAVTGASFRCDTLVSPAKGKSGKLRLVVAKDRLGNRAKGSTAAEIHMADEGTDRIALDFGLPEAQVAAARGETFRPTHLMERVSLFVEDNDGCSKKQIEDSVAGKSAAVRQAIDVLIDEGWITVVHEGQGKPIKHHVKTPYRESGPVDKSLSEGYLVPSSHLVPTSSLAGGTTPETHTSSPRPTSSPRVIHEDRGDEGRGVRESDTSSLPVVAVDNPTDDELNPLF